jgi:hypothetical protein
MLRGAAWVACAAWLVSILTGVVLVPPEDAEGVETLLTSRGADLARTSVSSTPYLRGLVGAQETVVLITDAEVPRAEQRLLREHVEQGGLLVVISTLVPERFLGADARWDVATLPGRIYGPDGGGVPLHRGAATAIVGDDVRALDLRRSGMTPLVESGPDSFRDANANADLDAGEAPGPFVVAAEAEVGSGRLVVVAREKGAPVSEALAGLVLDGSPTTAVLVVAPGKTALHAWSRAWLIPVYQIPGSLLLATLSLALAGAAALLVVVHVEPARAAASRQSALPGYLARLRERGSPQDRALLDRIAATKEARA